MTKRIAKRKLTNVDFQEEGSHVALVSKDQGGPANSHDYALVMKSNFSKEVIEKAQQVRVTLELPDFLCKFFHLYYEDAEVLARMMGYEPPEMKDDYAYDYEAYIQEKVNSFEILKSANESNATEVLATLDGDQYLQLLQDQEMFEKALTKYEKDSADDADKGLTDAKAKAKDSGKKKPKVKPSDVNKGKQMDENVEMIQKSQFEALQKANEAVQAELKKAQELVEAFKAEKQAAIEKARLEKLIVAVGDNTKADKLFKALKLVESDTEFNEAVAVLTEMHKAVEKSALFNEKGLNADDAVKVEESAVSKAIKKNLNK